MAEDCEECGDTFKSRPFRSIGLKSEEPMHYQYNPRSPGRSIIRLSRHKVVRRDSAAGNEKTAMKHHRKEACESLKKHA